jgi:hypothetical protein
MSTKCHVSATKAARTRLLRRASLRVLSGTVLWLSTAAWGQTTQVPPGQPSAGRPGVAAERQGRLLVLSYRAPDGEAQSKPGTPPRFAVYRGQRKIASGQFEYG